MHVDGSTRICVYLCVPVCVCLFSSLYPQPLGKLPDQQQVLNKFLLKVTSG